MKKRVKIAIIFVGVVVVACIAGFINAWILTGGIKLSDLTEEQKKITEKVIVKGIFLTETKEGKKYWEIYGENGQYLKSQNKILLNNVIGNFYDENGQVLLSFTGDKGEYYSEKRKVILTNRAKLASKNEVKMNAKKITWEGQNGMVHSEGDVHASQGDKYLITCDKSDFSTDFKYFHVSGHTKTRIYEKGVN